MNAGRERPHWSEPFRAGARRQFHAPQRAARIVGKTAGRRLLGWLFAWPVMLVRAAIRRPAIAAGVIVAVALLLTIGPTGLAVALVAAAGAAGTWAWIDRAAFMRAVEKAQRWRRSHRPS